MPPLILLAARGRLTSSRALDDDLAVGLQRDRGLPHRSTTSSSASSIDAAPSIGTHRAARRRAASAAATRVAHETPTMIGTRRVAASNTSRTPAAAPRTVDGASRDGSTTAARGSGPRRLPGEVDEARRRAAIDSRRCGRPRCGVARQPSVAGCADRAWRCCWPCQFSWILLPLMITSPLPLTLILLPLIVMSPFFFSTISALPVFRLISSSAIDLNLLRLERRTPWSPRLDCLPPTVSLTSLLDRDARGCSPIVSLRLLADVDASCRRRSSRSWTPPTVSALDAAHRLGHARRPR